jgi:hypothetical protein
VLDEPPALQRLFEGAARFMQLDDGCQRLELEWYDGKLVAWRRPGTTGGRQFRPGAGAG